MPVELVKKLDRHAEHLSKTTGMNVTRTDAILSLLTTALRKEMKAHGR